MIWFIIAFLGVVALVWIYSFINKRRFVKLFEQGNCIVSGLRGRGKDMAFCIVINARKKNYISNVEYSSPKKKFKHFEFDENVWELAGNSYEDFADGTLKHYVYPYPDDIDYYISDVGVYFPSQYQKQLVQKYGSAPFFQALSRHLGDCNVHCNTQNMPRVWDKIREQSDIYIRMDGCKVLFKRLVFLRSYVYETEESCNARLVPPSFGIGSKGKDRRIQWETAHGKIKRISFFAKLPFSYDSRRFKRLLENGLKDEDGQEV